jgi:hypothetical protein
MLHLQYVPSSGTVAQAVDEEEVVVGVLETLVVAGGVITGCEALVVAIGYEP